MDEQSEHPAGSKLQSLPITAISIALISAVVYFYRWEDPAGAWAKLSAMWPLLYDQPWRLVTSLLLHHDLPHLAGNLIFLLLFGWGLERTRGARRIASVFPGAVVTGHVISVTFAHDWIVGISGGVAGLFGYSLIASRRSPWWTTLTHQPLNAVYFLALTAPLLPALAEIFPYRFAHLKHLGGLLDGLAAGTALLSAPAKPLPRALAPHYRCCCLSASFTAHGRVNGGWFDTAQS